VAASFVRIRSLSYRWPSQAEDVFSDLDLTLDPGWTGVVGRNGSGKSTLLSLIAGDVDPDGGRIEGADSALLCEQRTDDAPDGLEAFARRPDSIAGRWASVLGIEADWPDRWDSLSHGERKRAQIAVALWREPEVLLVDEPMNHLDSRSRSRLSDALAEYRGIGVVVSHVRSLLDRICTSNLFLDDSGVEVRPGGVSAGMAEREREALAARRQRDSARKDWNRLAAEARRRSREAAGADRKRSKRNLAAKDHDGRAKLDLVRLSGKDGRAGVAKRRMDRRAEQAKRRWESMEVRSDRGSGITLAGCRARSDLLLRLESGAMDFADGRELSWPELILTPADRIALCGENGTGKSRLFSRIAEAAVSGSTGLVIPQEISAEGSRSLLESIRRLPKERLAEVYSAVDRLGSDPRRTIETALPSPGEMRKLMLGLGMTRQPAWIAMDEPTNHLDLVSIRFLEEALEAYEGALLLVSHDRVFLESTTDRRWTIEAEAGSDRTLILRTEER